MGSWRKRARDEARRSRADAVARRARAARAGLSWSSRAASIWRGRCVVDTLRELLRISRLAAIRRKTRVDHRQQRLLQSPRTAHRRLARDPRCVRATRDLPRLRGALSRRVRALRRDALDGEGLQHARDRVREPEGRLRQDHDVRQPRRSAGRERPARPPRRPRSASARDALALVRGRRRTIDPRHPAGRKCPSRPRSWVRRAASALLPASARLAEFETARILGPEQARGCSCSG